jgi:hypothetical protein
VIPRYRRELAPMLPGRVRFLRQEDSLGGL